MSTPIAIRITVAPERGGQDGTVRAAREMVAVATHMPGYIFHERVDTGRNQRAFDIYWTDLASIDAWRQRIYQSAQNRYSPQSWRTFSGIEVVRGRRLSKRHMTRASTHNVSAA